MTLQDAQAKLRALLSPPLTEAELGVLYWGEHEKTLWELVETFGQMTPVVLAEHTHALRMLASHLKETAGDDHSQRAPGITGNCR